MPELDESVDCRDAYDRGYMDGCWFTEKVLEQNVERAYDDGFSAGFFEGYREAQNERDW